MFLSMLHFFRILPDRFSRIVITHLFLFLGLIIGIRKRVVYEQLKHIFPRKSNSDIKQIIRQVYRNLALTSQEMFLNKDLANIEVEGWENILAALELNRGLILITGHMGNWELAGRYLARQNLPINVVIKRLRNGYFNDYVNKARNKDGIKIVYKTKTMRAILSALQNNEVVVLLIDQDAGKEGIVFPFLGRDASVFTGYARLAEHYDTPMIMGIALRKSDRINRFVFEEYVLPSGFLPEKDRKSKIVEYFNNRLAEYILSFPEQWFWVHRRWKGVNKAKRDL